MPQAFSTDADADADADAAGPAVLLLADDPVQLAALKALLQGTGARLVCAATPESAATCLAAGDGFALTVLDMAAGLDGACEAVHWLRDASQPGLAAIPVLVITAGDAPLPAQQRACALGAVDLLARPLLTALLRARVEGFLALYRAGTAIAYAALSPKGPADRPDAEHRLRAANAELERSVAERASELARERAFLAAVLEAVEDGIVACDAEGVLTLFNRATRQLHGLPESPVPAERWAEHYDLYRADGVTPFAMADIPLFRALAGEAVQGAEMVIAPRAAPRRTLLASGQPLYDPDGRKLGAVVSMHDVTAAREAEAARAATVREQARRGEAEAIAAAVGASEERVRLATEAADLGLWIWEPHGDRVIWESDWLYDMFGLPRSAQPVNALRLKTDFLHPDDVDAFVQATVATVKAGARLHVKGRFFRQPDLEERWLELTGRLQAATDHSPLRVLGTITDITDAKRAEQELRHSEDRYRTLFQSMEEGVCIIEMLFDAAGRPVDYRFLEANPAFEKQTGLHGAVGRTVRELVPGHDSHWFDIYGRVATTGEPVRLVEEARGLGRCFDVYASRVGGEGSRRVAVLFNDITVRQRAGEELRRLADELAEADRRKTEFLATLAHELRNPLAPLRNGLHLMRLAEGNPAAVARARDMMERQLAHMVHLVDDLLDIARIARGQIVLKKERIDLHAVLDGAVETGLPAAHAAGHALDVRRAAGRLWLDADPTRLAQVIGNLLHNAVKYTPQGGRIVLSVAREGGEAVLAVRDSGVGIPAESLSTVFEMFTQVGRNMARAQGGLGIGLALVRRLVELHGGTVHADSPGVGHGSLFTLRLPLSLEAQAPVGLFHGADLSRSAAPASASLRILVVDDNRDAADSLSAILQLAGHAVRTAHDGDAALAAAAAFGPQIAFLDIGMPGKNGYEVAAALRARPESAGLVLVALTGWGSEDDRVRSVASGFDRHLTKPADLAALEQVLALAAPGQK